MIEVRLSSVTLYFTPIRCGAKGEAAEITALIGNQLLVCSKIYGRLSLLWSAIFFKGL